MMSMCVVGLNVWLGGIDCGMDAGMQEEEMGCTPTVTKVAIFHVAMSKAHVVSASVSPHQPWCGDGLQHAMKFLYVLGPEHGRLYECRKCGCGGRQDAMMMLYPYPSPQHAPNQILLQWW